MLQTFRTYFAVQRWTPLFASLAVILSVSLASVPWMAVAQTPESTDPPPPVEESTQEVVEPTGEPIDSQDPPAADPDAVDPEDPPATDSEPVDPPASEPEVSIPDQPQPDEEGDSEPVDTETGDTESEQNDDQSQAEPEPASTDEADGMDEPSSAELDAVATPTEESEPTETPVPSVTWSQPDSVNCRLLAGSTAELEFDQSSTYQCVAQVHVSSDAEMPGAMQIHWEVEIGYPESFSFALPAGSAAIIQSEVPGATASSTRITLATPWQQASAIQQIAFDVTVTRTTCAVGEQLLAVQATPSITTLQGEAEIARMANEAHPQPALHTTTSIQSGHPDIEFDGPVVFDGVVGTSAGLESSVTAGTANITVTGEWDPCTSWTVDLSGKTDLPADVPAQLRVVSINDEPTPGGACDLSGQCELIVLPESGDAATPLRFTIGLELQLHDLTQVGNFSINLYAEIHGLDRQP